MGSIWGGGPCTRKSKRSEILHAIIAFPKIIQKYSRLNSRCKIAKISAPMENVANKRALKPRARIQNQRPIDAV